MEKITTDVAVIGAGTAGLVAYRNAKKYKDKVLIISNNFETTCANVGCMPSKLLISAANSFYDAKNSFKFGVEIKGNISINGKKVMERVRSERDYFVTNVIASVNKIKKGDLIQGIAKFIDNNTLEVICTNQNKKYIIEAKSIVIATGSSTIIPEIFKNAENRLLTNNEIFELEEIPKTIAVFGPGVIGLEIGQALSRLGAKVSLIGITNSLGPFTDPDLLNYAEKVFSDEFNIFLNAEILEIKKSNNCVFVKIKDNNGKIVEEKYEYIVSAVGRKPNLKQLCLENTDLELDKTGVPKFDKFTLKCGNSQIFIAGDANNDIPLLHEATFEGKVAGENAGKYPDIRTYERMSPISIVFTEPQIAIIGQSYKQIKEEQTIFAKGFVSFENQGRSRVILKNKGLMNIYAEYGTGKFLGAELIAPSGEHLAHLLAWAHQKKMKISEMLSMPFYHPVIEEGLRTALKNTVKNLRKELPLTECVGS